MKIQKPAPEIARIGLRGIKAVSIADGEFHALERGLMDAVQKHILGTQFDLDDLEPITPRELADGIPEPFREQFFNGCLIAALIDSDVLAEYETSPLEETQIAAFQAGLMRKQPMFGLFFMLAQFQLGIQVTPVTGAESQQVDPDLMIKALVRGTYVDRDLTANWDPWDDFKKPIVELRRAYNILPR